MRNRSMPSNRIIPVLSYHDVDAATLWIVKTLGFKIRWKAGSHRAQLSIYNSTIAITEVKQAFTSDGISIMIQVDDVTAHYQQAKNAGAKIITELRDYPYGERQYSLEDPQGHAWTFSQSIQDFRPEDWGGESFHLD
jgi:uncharacterized glyoxalase superfamily protein PhnB